MHYQIPVGVLLHQSGVSERVRITAPASRNRTPVPGIAGLFVSVEPLRQSPVELGWLRFGLWASVGLSGIGLFVVFRAHRREERAIAREKRFLANVTHELRTPLAAIRIFGESLERGRGDPVEYGELIAKESERLNGLIDRVLTVTRFDEAPRLARVQPCTLVEASVALLRERATAHSVRLESKLPTRELPQAMWDGEAVRGALINLLQNAIQHGGNDGHVTLGVESALDGIRFSVIDDGPGIHPQDRKRVFGRFERGDGAGAGTGLGLHVVEQVARAHGGRVDLETAPGQGCRFYLTLPLTPPQADATNPEADEPPKVST